MTHEAIEQRETLTVTQADRNAAVRLLEAGDQDWQAKEIRTHNGDHFPIVQAFARHRLAAEQAFHQSTTSLEAERDALAKRVAALEAALRPFANAVDIHFDHAEGDTMMVLRYRSGEPTGACLASLDRARAALTAPSHAE